MYTTTQSLILPIQIFPSRAIVIVVASHVMVVVVCLSSSQSQDQLVLFDILNPSGQLDGVLWWYLPK